MLILFWTPLQISLVIVCSLPFSPLPYPFPSQVTQLRDWLSGWHDRHGEAARGPKAKKGRGGGGGGSGSGAWGGGGKDMDKKAVLLSGGPGIGKTTTAKLVCAELGYLPLEVGGGERGWYSQNHAREQLLRVLNAVVLGRAGQDMVVQSLNFSVMEGGASCC